MSATVYVVPARNGRPRRARGRARRARRRRARGVAERLRQLARARELPRSGRRRVRARSGSARRTSTGARARAPGRRQVAGRSLGEIEQDRSRLRDRRAVIQLERRDPPVRIAGEVGGLAGLAAEEVDGTRESVQAARAAGAGCGTSGSCRRRRARRASWRGHDTRAQRGGTGFEPRAGAVTAQGQLRRVGKRLAASRFSPLDVGRRAEWRVMHAGACSSGRPSGRGLRVSQTARRRCNPASPRGD